MRLFINGTNRVTHIWKTDTIMMFSTGTIFLAASTIALLLCVVDNAVSGKKGVCAYAPYILCDDFRVLNNISWWYGWRDAYRLYDQHVTQKCPSPHAQMPEFVPMVWSIHSNESSRWIHIPPGSQFVLGYNEPDHVPQAHMTPQEAAMYWPMIEKAAVGIPLVAPAPASHGFHWLDQFFHLCNSCRIDYVAAHSYLCNADQTMAYLKAMYNRYHKKVWLTEFACAHTPDDHVQLGLMRTLLPKLEAAEFVYRYSWFMARVKDDAVGGFVRTSMSLLFRDSPTLTRLGHFYNEFQPGHGSVPVG